MEKKPIALRLFVGFISILLFVISAFGVALMYDSYVAQKDYPTEGSIVDHVFENVEFYADEITNR